MVARMETQMATRALRRERSGLFHDLVDDFVLCHGVFSWSCIALSRNGFVTEFVRRFARAAALQIRPRTRSRTCWFVVDLLQRREAGDLLVGELALGRPGRCGAASRSPG